MIRIVIALAAALTAASLDPGPDPVEALLSGAADPVAYDYGQLRERPDADAWLEAAEARARRVILKRQGLAEDADWDKARFATCMSEGDLAVLKGLSSVRRVKTRAEWRAARLQADDAVARREAIRRVLFAGEASPYDQLRGVERRLKLAKAAADPAVAELFRRNAQDNFARLGIGFSARQFMLQDLSPAALDLYDATVNHETCLVDEANLVWLKATIAERGWFRINRDGEQADSAAWNMVQHADKDPAFQQSILALLETEVAAKETEPANYAYLYDRVAVNTGKPQRYATQGRCAGPGDWRPDQLEDPDGVEARRAAMGIDWPMKDYIAKMNTFCR